MTTSYILPLKAPTPLPASGVDTVTFKVWKNTLIAHIQQDAHHHNFMPGGLYSEWQAAEYGSRISALDDDDPDKLVIDGKRERLGENGYRAEIASLLTKRNAQLAKYITHIATLCHHTENDDVTTQSTSLQWIFDYLMKHYGLETKGANFMNISEHVFKQGTPYQTFYKQYRASFIDNLRKRGDAVLYKNDFILTEDEKLSPSFENAIILWSLEKIDARLPAKVKKNYGHQMTGNVTLKDIQPVIFDNISSMLEELEQSQTVKAFATDSQDPDPMLQAVDIQNKQRRSFKPFVQRSNRGSSRSTSNSLPKSSYTSRNPSRQSASTKFCRICNLAGSSPQIYLSHEIGECGRLSKRDLESIKSSLVLNGIISDETQEEPSCEFIPGWDEQDEGDLQQDENRE